MPKLSVITVCLNAKDTIEKTIQSVIGQTFQDYEYIIIDGGSTDGTKEIIEKYLPRIHRFISEPDKGISDAFNKGIEASGGEWINFLNSGDIFIQDNVLKNMVPYLQRVDIVTAFAKFGRSTIPKKILSNTDKLRDKAMISHQASFVRRSIFYDIGMFDTSYSIRMDYDFWLRSLKKYRFRFIDSTIVNYGQFGMGVSGRNISKFHIEELKANKKNLINYNLPNCLVFFKFIRSLIAQILPKSINC